MEKVKSFLKNVKNIIILILIMLSMILGYFLYEFNLEKLSLKGEVESLVNDKLNISYELDNKNAELKSQAGLTEDYKFNAEFFREMSSFLADKFDSMDNLVVKTDNLCLDTVTYFYDNALFYDDEREYASGVMGEFRAKHESLSDDYIEIKEDLYNTIDKIDDVLND